MSIVGVVLFGIYFAILMGMFKVYEITGFFWVGDFKDRPWLTLFTFIIAGIPVLAIALKLEYREQKKRYFYEQELLNTGFNVNYRLKAMNIEVLFDTTNKKIGFIYLNAYSVFKFEDILDCKWASTEQLGTTKENLFQFRTRDPSEPLILVSMPTTGNSARDWHAKINAILNMK